MKHNVVRKILALILVLGILSTIGSGLAIAAPIGQNDTVQNSYADSTEKLELKCPYPILRDVSGQSFDFTVTIAYSGSAPKKFDLSVTAPSGWIANVLRETEDVEAPAIQLTPNRAIPDSLRVRLASPTDVYPEPGDYTVTFKASSGDITETIDLTATVTAIYRFAFYTESEQLSAKVTAGKNNQISLVLFNTGTAPIQKISFTSEKPSGWNITFEPNDITILETGKTARVYMVINAPEKTVAGDYLIKVSAVPSEALPSSVLNMSAGHDMEIRVTVSAPTIWGVVSIIVVAAVIGCVLFIFRRLGRR